MISKRRGSVTIPIVGGLGLALLTQAVTAAHFTYDLVDDSFQQLWSDPGYWTLDSGVDDGGNGYPDGTDTFSMDRSPTTSTSTRLAIEGGPPFAVAGISGKGGNQSDIVLKFGDFTLGDLEVQTSTDTFSILSERDRNFTITGVISGSGHLELVRAGSFSDGVDPDELTTITGAAPNTITGNIRLYNSNGAGEPSYWVADKVGAFGQAPELKLEGRAGLSGVASLQITSNALGGEGAIDDDATSVYLGAESILSMDSGVDEKIGAGKLLIDLNGTGTYSEVPVGIYDQTEDWITGDGTVTVGNPSDPNLDIDGIVTIEDSIQLVSQGGFEVGAAEGVKVFIGDGSGFLPGGGVDPGARGILLTNATVGIVKSGTDYAVVASGDAGSVGIPGLTVAGTVTARVNMLSLAVDETVTVPGTSNTVNVAFSPGETSGGPGDPFYSITGSDFVIDINGQTISGDLNLRKLPVVRGSGPEVALSFGLINGITSFGNGMSELVSVADASGYLLAFSDGLAGSLAAGNVAVTGAANTGTYHLEINTTGTPVDETFDTGGSLASVMVEAGNFIRIAGPASLLDILGQILSGDFLFQQDPSGDVTVLATGVVTSFTDGGTNLVTLFDASGAILLTPGGAAAQLSGPLLLNVPNASVSGNFGLSINNTSLAVNRTIDIGGSLLDLNLEAGNYARIGAAGAGITLGGQVVLGDFTFEQGSGSVVGSATSVASAFGSPGNELLSLSADSGVLLLGSTGSAAVFTGAAVTSDPNTSLVGPVDLRINTTGMAINETVAVAGIAGTLEFTAPDTINMTASAAQLGVLGSTLAGDFQFEENGGGDVVGVVSNASLALNDGSSDLVAVSGSTGVIFMSTPGTAIEFSGDIATTVPGTGASGIFTAAANTGSTFVSETLNVGGQTVSLDLLPGPFLQLTGTGAILSIQGQAISGDMVFERKGDGTIVALVTGGLYTQGGGLAALNDLTGPLLFSGSGVAGELDGIPALAIPGLLTASPFGLQINTTNTPVDKIVEINSSTFSVSVPGGNFLRLVGESIGVQIAGLDLLGSFLLEEVAPDTISLQAIDASFSMGPGVLDAFGCAGTFLANSSGVGGGLSLGGFAFSAPEVGLTGIANRIEFNTSPTPVTGNFELGGGTESLSLPAGPYAGVPFANAAVTLNRLQLGGVPTGFIGDFLVDQFEGKARLGILQDGSVGTDTTLNPGTGALRITEGNLITSLSGSQIDFGTSLDDPVVITGGTFGVDSPVPLRIHPASIKSGDVPLIDFSSGSGTVTPADFQVSPPLPTGFSLAVSGGMLLLTSAVKPDSDGDGLSDEWEETYGPDTTSLSPDDQSDGDLYPAIVEFALGLDPTVADTPTLTTSIEEVGGQHYLTLTYPRNPDAIGLLGILTQRSTDLGQTDPWSIDDTVWQSGTDIEITDRSIFPTTANPSEFLRLNVVKP